MRKLRKFFCSSLLFLIAAVAAGPVCYLLWGCFTNLEGFWLTFLRTPEYLYKFWSSLGICAVISFGQVSVSCMGGMALAKYPIPGRRIWIGMLIVMLLLPLQVTLVPNYLILDRLGLLDTVWALIFPGIFSPLGTVVMWITFRSVSDELVDAAQLDGARTETILWKILVPAGKSGIASVFLLSFIDAWNMVEQPMVFLKDQSQYPLSVFLASLGKEGFSLGFHSGLLSLLPAVLLLLYFRQELVEGVWKENGFVLPKEALYTGTQGECLYYIEEREGIFQTEYIVKEVLVTVIEENMEEGTVMVHGVYNPEWVYASNADGLLQNEVEVKVVP